MIYLDHAATSFPKPERVIRAVERCLREVAGSPARGGHAGAIDANRLVFEARARAAELLGVRDAARVVLTSGATTAINTALRGTLRRGDLVLVSDMEHNAVARPLAALRREGVMVSVVAHEPDPGRLVAALDAAATSATRWLVVNHASNVNGQSIDLGAAAEWARARGIRVGVDAAQSAGLLPLDVDGWELGWLACSGHKGLHGPAGVGLLAVGRDVVIEPLIRGGTGSHSDSDEQPHELPEALESGTPNTPGIAGLSEGIAGVLESGVEALHKRSLGLARRLAEGLAAIEGVDVWGPGSAMEGRAPSRPLPNGRPGVTELPVPVLSFRLRGTDPAMVAADLDTEWDVRVRVGLHCAPAAHRRLGTFPEGTLRASIGPGNTEEEIDTAVEAIRALSRS